MLGRKGASHSLTTHKLDQEMWECRAQEGQWNHSRSSHMIIGDERCYLKGNSTRGHVVQRFDFPHWCDAWSKASKAAGQTEYATSFECFFFLKYDRQGSSQQIWAALTQRAWRDARCIQIHTPFLCRGGEAMHASGGTARRELSDKLRRLSVCQSVGEENHFEFTSDSISCCLHTRTLITVFWTTQEPVVVSPGTHIAECNHVIKANNIHQFLFL